MRTFFIKAVSTFLYIGYLPFARGTFGSIAGVLIFLLFKDYPLLQIGLAIAFLFAGFMTSGKAEKIFNQKDPGQIVIDEVAGMFLTLLFLPYDIRLVIAGFVLFRIFDCLKPYPADLIQRLEGSLGVMGDDIAAAVYTNIVLQVVLRLASFKAS